MRVPTIATAAVCAAALSGCGEQPRTPAAGTADGGGPSVRIYTPSPDLVRAGPAQATPEKLAECGRYVTAPRGEGDVPEPQFCAQIIRDLVARRPTMSGDEAADRLIASSRPLTPTDRAEGARTESGRVVNGEAAYRRAGLGRMWDEAERRMAEADAR